jgi:hypothetical protein
MRLFFSRATPEFTQLVLVESGSRYILDNLLPGLTRLYGERLRIDLVTCFTGVPAGFPPGSRIFRVWDYPTPAARKHLLKELLAAQPQVCGIICSGEPVMTKWKWWLAFRITAKVFVLNENGDYYWFDYSNWRTMLHFIFFRLGLTGADPFTTLTRLLLFPFTLCYLLLYAAVVHLRRKVRV